MLGRGGKIQICKLSSVKNMLQVVKITIQAGAELGQAQLKLGLGFTSIKFGLPDSGGRFVFKNFCCMYNI